MISDRDPFSPVLHQFLNVKYEVTQVFAESSGGSKAAQPLSFFDHHISSNLQLKSVKRAPWIPKALAQICEDVIKDFTAAGHSFVENEGYWNNISHQPVNLSGCISVAEYHFGLITHRCNAFASKLLFHPRDPEWFSFLTPWTEHLENKFFSVSGATSLIRLNTADSGERDFNIPPATRETLADWVVPTLVKLSSSRPKMVHYQFYAQKKQSAELLEKMGPCIDFNWETAKTTGAPAVPASAPPLDSRIIKSLFPALATAETKQTGPEKKKRRIVPPLERSKHREHQYRMNVDQHIQKVWIDAMEDDSTFIVFSCGRLERIGIRHRGSQTLYLSDLINPARMKGYGQMHLGLTLAALKDGLDRLDMEQEPKPRSKKRAGSPSQHIEYNSMKDKATRRKRRKLNPELELTSLDTKAFDDELAQRDLILLHFNFPYYESPAPSSFRRMEPSCVPRPFNNSAYHFKRKQAYPPQSYISVTAHSDSFGSGSVGLVYRVSVDIELASGSKHQRNLILKLAVGPKKAKIVEEYKYYKQLARANVTRGIVGVHGLFHDMETDAMIMLMEDAGKSLRTRAMEQGVEPEFNDITELDCLEITDEECIAFVEVLEGIHGAGIIHDDLRIDNLMVNDTGEVFIIDFDCAQQNRNDSSSWYDKETSGMVSTIWGTACSSDEEESNDEPPGESEHEQRSPDCPGHQDTSIGNF